MAKEDLRGKAIVVTGASSGFGKGVAREFAQAGAGLALAARRGDLLEELAEECRAMGGRCVVAETDVSRSDQVEALALLAASELGAIDVWINNAGAGAFGPFEAAPLADHVQVIETDLLGTLYGSYYAMQAFRRQGHGVLINVSSVLGAVPMPYYSSYTAAKHGVNALSAAIRLELEQDQIDSIRVCTVMPTSTDTPFFEHAANYSGHEYKPTPPVYEPEDVIKTIVSLASEPEDQVPVGMAAQAAILAHRLAPSLVESRIGKQTHETMENAPPAPKGPGSLREPVSTGIGVKSTRSKKS